MPQTTTSCRSLEACSSILFNLVCLFGSKSVMYTAMESMRISNTLMGEKSLSQ